MSEVCTEIKDATKSLVQNFNKSVDIGTATIRGATYTNIKDNISDYITVVQSALHQQLYNTHYQTDQIHSLSTQTPISMNKDSN